MILLISEYISLLMLTILNYYHICIFQHKNQFFIRNGVFPLIFKKLFLEINFVIVLHNNALNCLLDLIINQLILMCCFIAICWNLSLQSFSLLEQQCCNFFQKFINMLWNKKFPLHIQCKIHLICKKKYHSIQLFYIEILKLSKFPIK